MYLLFPLSQKTELAVVMAVSRLLVAKLTSVVVVVVVVMVVSLLTAAGRWYLLLLLLRRSEVTVVRMLILLTVLLAVTTLLEEVAEGDGTPLVSIRSASRTISSKETRRTGFGESTSVMGEFCLLLSARRTLLQLRLKCRLTVLTLVTMGFSVVAALGRTNVMVVVMVSLLMCRV